MSDLTGKIPNNVDLANDKKLKRALESWLPNFLDWWGEMGPEGFQTSDVYLRTAVGVDAKGWAQFDYVKMPEYRWGIFLSPRASDTIGFGDNEGKPVWDTAPGEVRKDLRRLIVTQGDTEPASIEQQRMLGKTAPSLYDLRNLFQVNVEEGRHLWAMVYLLHSYFGRDGREEAEDLLTRRSGHEDTPRILSTFNEPVENWVDFFMFTMFVDRDGKYQLAALAESAFDPLARTAKFMLTEEAHHLFVGETGIRRIVAKTAELMKESASEDVTKRGGIPLDMVQRYINQWYSLSLDLFGAEESSNAANFFSSGLKGRYKEGKYTDHAALEQSYEIQTVSAQGSSETSIPMRRAMNAVLQDDYITDCQRALEKWNKTLAKAGMSERLTLPSRRFHRTVGFYSDLHFDTRGELLSKEQFEGRIAEFLPSESDRSYVNSLMQPVHAPGEFAGWIAPPTTGVKGQPLDMEYVRLDPNGATT